MSERVKICLSIVALVASAFASYAINEVFGLVWQIAYFPVVLIQGIALGRWCGDSR